MEVIHCLGIYTTPQDDEKLIDSSKLNLGWENRQEGFLGEDITIRINEHWVKNRIWISTWLSIYNRNFLLKYNIKFLDCLIEDMSVAFEALCFAKKYLMLHDAVYIWRKRSNSCSSMTDFNRFKLCVKSFVEIPNAIEKVMNKIPALKDNRTLKEQSALQIIGYVFPGRIVPFYNESNITAELDNAVYEALVPIFNENTTMAKYFFHGFNTMWRQANILAQQNYHLRQREDLITKQSKLIEQLRLLLDQYDRKS